MDFRLTICPAVEGGRSSISFVFETKKELIAAKNTAADLLLFLQIKIKVMDDYSNIFISEEKVGHDWEKIE